MRDFGAIDASGVAKEAALRHWDWVRNSADNDGDAIIIANAAVTASLDGGMPD
jgi:hypothetical protein